MSNYQPKVGDKVMVGEHGPYRVPWIDFARRIADLRTIPEGKHVGTGVPFSWLTPAPEPEPDEPTAPGALVRAGTGSYAVRSDTAVGAAWTVAGGVHAWEWERLIRPITVILNDPAEVEALRAEVEKLRDWHVQHGMSPAMLSDPHKWDGRDCWCPAGVDHDESPVVVSQDKWRRLEAERDELQRRIETAEEVASHATVSADRFELERNELKRRADDLDRALRSIERTLASENLSYIRRVMVARGKAEEVLGD